MPEEDTKYLRPIIIDVGTANFRMGWGGEDYPEIISPSVYVDKSDYLFNSEVIEGLEEIFLEEKDEDLYLYGNKALNYQNILKVHEFKKEGNYNILSKFFHHYYKKLEIPEEYRYLQPIIILSPFIMTDMEKTKLKRIFFNEYHFPYLVFLSERKAILSTLNKASGVIINIGEANAYLSTILHGFSNIMARDIFPISGETITDYFLNLILQGKGSKTSVYLDKWLAREIKEKTALCVMNYENELRKVKEGLTKYDRTIKLPDNSSLKINSERFKVIEPFFNPKLIHIDYPGLAESIANIIKFWDRENWAELLGNVVLSGGASLITGFKERLKMELKEFFSPKLQPKIKIIAVSGRDTMAWIGASILFMKDKLDEGWIKNPELETQKTQVQEEIEEKVE
ncbi:MAG: Actin-like protein [Promethearchaeota archaeon]|nr:MAG: Actin-like protein [Candidatus Lokiarchaeota archaeon]